VLHLLAGVGYEYFLMQHLCFLGSAVEVSVLWAVTGVQCFKKAWQCQSRVKMPMLYIETLEDEATMLS
jgi:hypothetical protein